MAYKDLQRFQLKIIFRLKIMFLEKSDLHIFQLKGMVLGNRNIISPLRVRGSDYRSGSELVQDAITINLIRACPLLV
jgi:hypothetical protein